MLLHQDRPATWRFADGVTAFGSRTSLIAAFSSARSAYIRLSLAFSASSSFSRFSSSTDAPAYFDPPLEVGRLADAVLPQQLRDRDPAFALLQDRDDLALA